jgi:hypothetical protein
MRARAILIACAASVLGLSALVALAPVSSAATTAAPAAVTNLAPFESRSTVPVRWSPVARRIPVINATGWPEFRLLPHTTP